MDTDGDGFDFVWCGEFTEYQGTLDGAEARGEATRDPKQCDCPSCLRQFWNYMDAPLEDSDAES